MLVRVRGCLSNSATLMPAPVGSCYVYGTLPEPDEPLYAQVDDIFCIWMKPFTPPCVEVLILVPIDIIEEVTHTFSEN